MIEMSDKTKNITKEEWRLLGYYYVTDHENKKWIFIGSKYGLEGFCFQLEDYAKNKENNTKGEHEHLGPYSYLKIMTWDTAEITKGYICGSLDDLRKLSILVKNKLKNCDINQTFTIKDEYCSCCEYFLEFQIKEYGFDPATADKKESVKKFV